MQLPIIAVAAFAALLVISGSKPAEASVVDFYSTDPSLGVDLNNSALNYIPVGQTGTIYGLLSHNGFPLVSGTLRGHSQIIFSYTLTGAFDSQVDSRIFGSFVGPYDYFESYASTASGERNISIINGVTEEYVNNLPVAAIAVGFNSADGGSAIITLTNTANYRANIESMLLGGVLEGYSPYATYSVSSLNAVPLPSSLPMFIFALLGIAGFIRFRRHQALAKGNSAQFVV